MPRPSPSWANSTWRATASQRTRHSRGDYTLAAANHGIAAAKYNAGLRHPNGAGPAADLAEAYKWFALAAQVQYPGADRIAASSWAG